MSPSTLCEVLDKQKYRMDRYIRWAKQRIVRRFT
jgi:hypothetical protein